MVQTQVTKNEDNAVQSAEAKETEMVYLPDVDICEDNERIRLLADMPGVDRESVDVTVEKNTLTVEGRTHVEGPKGYELVGQEYGAGKYRRDFTLSDDVDVEGVKARMKNGVLEVTIPKREEVKTRRIEITN